MVAGRAPSRRTFGLTAIMIRRMDYDLFTCSECGAAVYAFPHSSPTPTMCSNCYHLEKYVDDPIEREAMRRRSGIGTRWHKPRKFTGPVTLS